MSKKVGVSMKVICNFTWKSFIFQKKKTVVTILSVILSGILMFGVGIGVSTYSDYQKKVIQNTEGEYHAVIENIHEEEVRYLKQQQPIQMMYFKQKLGIFEMTKYQTSDTSIEPDNSKLEIQNIDSYFFQTLPLVAGKYSENETELMISETLYRDPHYDFNIGDTLEFEKSGKWFQYQIVGIYETNMNELSGQTLAYTALQSNITEVVDVYLVYHNIREVVPSLEKIGKERHYPYHACMDLICYENIKTHNSLLALEGISADSSHQSFLLLTSMFLLLIITLACVFVIYNGFAISVTERKRMFGILSSIGATPKQLFASVFLEATIIACIGIPLAFISCIVVSQLLIVTLNHILASAIPITLSIQALYILLPVFFLFITVYLSALFPAEEARHLTPIAAIKGMQDIRFSKKKVKTAKYLSVSSSLALKNMKRNKKKFRITILSLVISIVLFNSISVVVYYASQSYLGEDEEIPYDIYLSLEAKQPEEISKIKTKIKKLDDTKEVISYYTFATAAEYAEKKKNQDSQFVVFVVMDSETIQMIRKQYHLEEKKPIFLNLQRNRNLSNPDISEISSVIDSKVPFQICHLDDQFQKGNCEKTIEDYEIITQVPFQLERDFLNLVGSVFFLEEKDSETYLPLSNQQNDAFRMILYFNTKNPKETDVAVKQIVKDSKLSYYYIRNQGLELVQAKKSVLIAKLSVFGIIFFISFIAVTSAWNTIVTALQLRKKELAVLRSIGMEKKKVRNMILQESIFVALKAIVIGLSLSFLVLYGFSKIVHFATVTTNPYVVDKTFHWNNLIIPYPYLISSVVATFLVLFIATLLALPKVQKNNIVDTLKEDNL